MPSLKPIGILLLAAAFATMGAEVPSGLIFHLDASAQKSGRSKAGLPSIANGQPLDFAVDIATGEVSFQPSMQNRPVLVTGDSDAYLKFDGVDDYLFWPLSNRPVAALTVFVLAAPKTNAGNFSGLLATAKAGQNDYTSGFNFDFGPAPTKELSVLNVESAGAAGFRDLLERGFVSSGERPFGNFHVFTVRSQPGKAGTQVFLDGFKGGERDRSKSEIEMNQLTVGSRLYSNDGNQPPFAQGFFHGAVAEVLVFDRALNDSERESMEQRLLGKTVALNGLLHGAGGHGLETAKGPPPVQMLVPGFTVEELPLKIGNLNNVRYRHDGKVVGLGYDGRIHLLTDQNADGLEDRSDLFWDRPTLRSPIGMALLPKSDPRGDGVFVASKGKVSLILDKDRDGRGDEELVIASGWQELNHGVDTLGLALDPKDGSIYFGLGCANFVNAYQVDPSGKAGYSLSDIHGTIQRISPDFATRETVCTGVRFTCALAFNRAGDLFATDQEGATWLPNGNPLDELLHIQKGKHYGFPPRHPKHLPNVIDQPPVIEFGPQHQSTVGLVFNEDVNGGSHFGPAHWAGDAIICGESRGKIWRTKLAPTPQGYVGQNQLVACLGLLTVDACVTPIGDLLVACHSGPPDWGTGPTGEGRLFKLRYTGRTIPQPVIAWAAARDEFRVAFDRPLDAPDWRNARERVRIEAGKFVSAGDRFEVLRPGYQVVRDQMGSPRRWVEVLGLSLSEDSRTVVLRVPTQTEAVNYAITLPLPDRWKQRDGVKQHPEIDMLLDLHGILATKANAGIRTVLPHPSSAVAKVLTQGSEEHERFLANGSPTTLHARIDLANPFVPATQPGAKLDWDPNTDSFGSAKFSARIAEGGEVSSGTELKATVNKDENFFLQHDTLKHPIAPGRLLVPWAADKSEKIMAGQPRTDVRGHWLRGRRLFFGESGCATCHTVRGEGISFGPDLSNLIFRDRESVVADIVQPSATINPDHAGTSVALKDGVMLDGLMRSPRDDQFSLALPAGAQVQLLRANVAKLEPMKTSLMPAGLGDRLTPEQMEDLLMFLLTNPLEPAAIARQEPPRPAVRGLPEVTEVTGSMTQPPPGQSTTLRILLCSGPKDHGIDEHDYPLWLDRWARLFALGENVTVATSPGFPSSQQLANADVAVFFNANPDWNAEKAEMLDSFHRRGGGAVYLHYAVDGGKDPAGAAERMGLSFTLGSRFRHGDLDLIFSAPDHPITRGLPSLHLTDETYWNMKGDLARLNVLGTVMEEGAPRPQLWTLERFKSRIVGCIPGHYSWTFDDPLFRVLVLRSICWSARQENVDRLAELALVGASVRPASPP